VGGEEGGGGGGGGGKRVGGGGEGWGGGGGRGWGGGGGGGLEKRDKCPWLVDEKGGERFKLVQGQSRFQVTRSDGREDDKLVPLGGQLTGAEKKKKPKPYKKLRKGIHYRGLQKKKKRGVQPRGNPRNPVKEQS